MSRFIIRSLDSYNEKSYEIVTGKKLKLLKLLNMSVS